MTAFLDLPICSHGIIFGHCLQQTLLPPWTKQIGPATLPLLYSVYIDFSLSLKLSNELLLYNAFGLCYEEFPLPQQPHLPTLTEFFLLLGVHAQDTPH